MNKLKKTFLYYDGIAQGYKDLYHEEQIKKIILVEKYFLNNGLMLDLGSGDGVLNQFISENVDLISFDLSFNLLNLNNNKYKIQGIIEKLPFKDNVFDCVCAFTSIQDIENPCIAIINVQRILKKRGIFILSFLKISSSYLDVLREINKYFDILIKLEEEKDYIFVLKRK
ncbi:MAG: methyltransferase domain-containing protein [Nanoarchaeota archaeon]